MSEVNEPDFFPHSAQYPFQVTSPEDVNYNCIAWACEDTEKWYWPDPFNFYYWPDGIAREESIQAFKALFELLGYEACEDGEWEDGYQKVALFADRNKTPQHAARQLSNGMWTSKLGNDIDVEHHLFAMEEGFYGNVCLFMKKPVTSP